MLTRLAGDWPAFRQDALGLLARRSPPDGTLGRLRLGLLPVWLLTAPDAIHAALVTYAEAFDKGPLVYQALAPVLGDGLLNSSGAAHHAHRQALAPAFAPRCLAGYAATMTRCAAAAVAAWPAGGVLALAPALRHLTLRITAEVCFGPAIPPLDDLASTINAAVDWMGAATRRMLPLPAAWPGGCSPATRSMLRRFRQRIGTQVAARRAAGCGGDGLVAHLLQAGWSDAAIVDELRMFLVIGHETPANALTWCFDLLARHSAVAARLRAELAAVLQGRLPTLADLPNLLYTR